MFIAPNVPTWASKYRSGTPGPATNRRCGERNVGLAADPRLRVPGRQAARPARWRDGSGGRRGRGCHRSGRPTPGCAVAVDAIGEVIALCAVAVRAAVRAIARAGSPGGITVGAASRAIVAGAGGRNITVGIVVDAGGEVVALRSIARIVAGWDVAIGARRQGVAVGASGRDISVGVVVDAGGEVIPLPAVGSLGVVGLSGSRWFGAGHGSLSWPTVTFTAGLQGSSGCGVSPAARGGAASNCSMGLQRPERAARELRRAAAAPRIGAGRSMTSIPQPLGSHAWNVVPGTGPP